MYRMSFYPVPEYGGSHRMSEWMPASCETNCVHGYDERNIPYALIMRIKDCLSAVICRMAEGVK
jgi:hypothetical protein